MTDDRRPIDGLAEGHRLIAEHFRALDATRRADRWARFKRLPWHRKLGVYIGFACMGLGMAGLFFVPKLLIVVPAVPLALGAYIAWRMTGDDWFP